MDHSIHRRSPDQIIHTRASPPTPPNSHAAAEHHRGRPPWPPPPPSSLFACPLPPTPLRPLPFPRLCSGRRVAVWRPRRWWRGRQGQRERRELHRRYSTPGETRSCLPSQPPHRRTLRPPLVASAVERTTCLSSRSSRTPNSWPRPRRWGFRACIVCGNGTAVICYEAGCGKRGNYGLNSFVYFYHQIEKNIIASRFTVLIVILHPKPIISNSEFHTTRHVKLGWLFTISEVLTYSHDDISITTQFQRCCCANISMCTFASCYLLYAPWWSLVFVVYTNCTSLNHTLPLLCDCQVERSSSSYSQHRPRRPPPDLPSLLLHGRIVYIGMPV